MEPQLNNKPQLSIKKQSINKSLPKEYIVEKNISFANFCKDNYVNLTEWARRLVGKNLEKKC
jgi:hypothetical protein